MASSQTKERVSFVNKISSVMKATSDDESPIPGYLYPQIANISWESDIICESLMEFLVERLDRKSYHVKLKILKLMKYVVENGNPKFTMGLRKKSRGIQEATVFGGAPDPFHGNIPYLLVRKAAKELSEIVFDTERDVWAGQGRHKPMMISTGGMGSGPESQSLQGFGNTNNQTEKSLGGTIITGLNRLAEKVADSRQTELPSLTQSPGEYRPALVNTGDLIQSTTPTIITPAPRKHIPGRAGGGWDDDLETEGHLGVKLSSGSHSDGSPALSDRYGSCSSNEDWLNEENLVTESTDKPERFLLTRADINQFIQRCQSVNCEKTVELINKSLVIHPDHVTVKCLQLLEGFLRCDLVSMEFIGRVCRDNLLTVFHSNTSQVKAKAKKIIRILEKLTSQSNILPVETKPNRNLREGDPVAEDNYKNNFMCTEDIRTVESTDRRNTDQGIYTGISQLDEQRTIDSVLEESQSVSTHPS